MVEVQATKLFQCLYALIPAMEEAQDDYQALPVFHQQ
jgi:hypothetical protein